MRDETLDVEKWEFGIDSDGDEYSSCGWAYALPPRQSDGFIDSGTSVALAARTDPEKAESDLVLLKTSVADMLSTLNGGPSKDELMKAIFSLMGDNPEELLDRGYCADELMDFRDLIARHDKATKGAG